MKHRTRIALAFAGAAAAFASPAMAATSVDTNHCVSVTDTHGCLFNGNINEQAGGNNGYVTAQNAYNAVRNPDITLNYLAKSDLGGFTGTVVGTGSSGTWSLAGYVVDFIAVKAGNDFVLYQLATPSSSGSWSTIDLGNKDISHLEFFGSVVSVPEPASWAMLIAGMGIVGAAMRRRKGAVSFA